MVIKDHGNPKSRRSPTASAKGDLSIASKIRRYYNGLRGNKMFATRQILQFSASRASIDTALWRMVRDGELIRLASGVFMPNRPGLKVPTVHEIAKFKAQVFKKKVFVHAQDACSELNLSPGNEQVVYATNGGSSSFKVLVHRTRVTLKNTCLRKLDEMDSASMKAMRAVSHKFKDEQEVDSETIESLRVKLGFEGWRELLSYSDRMYWWVWGSFQPYASRIPGFSRPPLGVRESCADYAVGALMVIPPAVVPSTTPSVIDYKLGA